MTIKKYNYWRATLICGIAALFYLYEFVLQVSPSVMTGMLMLDLHTSAAGLGVISAFYFYSYAPMQLPAGLLYDKYGPRRLVSIAILVCASGAVLFGATDSFILVCTGRFLMGIGSAFAFIGALLLISRWFPLKYFALLVGVVQFLSSIGAVVGEIPLSRATLHFGWHHTIIFIGLFGIVLAVLAWIFIRDFPSHLMVRKKVAKSIKVKTWARLREVFSHRQNAYIALYAFFAWAPITVFASLWGIPFLAAEYGVDTRTAAEACAMIWLGIGIGSPLLGWWSDKINQRCLPLSVAAIIGVVALVVILYAPNVPFSMMFFFLFLFGLAAAGQSLSFGLVKDNNSHRVVGTAIGFNNMAVVLGGAIFQPLTGVLLKMYWGHEIVHGIPIYSVSDYRIAMLILPLCYLAAFIVSKTLLKETYCKETYALEKL